MAATVNRYGVALRPVARWDLPSLRRWRNTPEISQQMMNCDRIMPKQQRQWFESLQQRPEQRHWTVWCKGVKTGYANLKGENRGDLFGQAVVESGLYLANTPVRNGLLATAVALNQLDAAFEILQVHRIETMVKATNTAALRLNQLLGYAVVSSNECVHVLDLTPERYFKARAKLVRYFSHV